MEMTLNNKNLTVAKWNYGGYSYDTVVAFEGYNSQGEYFYCVCENCWGTTTGKHLNWIDSNKNNRLKRDEFKTKLNQFLQ